MGLLNFFRKKTDQTIQVAQEVAPDQINKDLYVLVALEARLVEMGYKVEWHQHYMALIVNDELEMATKVIEHPDNHPTVMHLLVAATHAKFFPKGIVESIAGFGHTINDQVKSVLDNYINSTFITIVDGLSDTHDPNLDFKTVFNGREILWHPKLGNLSFQGEWETYPDGEPLFEMLKDDIKNKLGSNKINWIKIYISKRRDGEIIGECLFNNELWEAATNKIEDYAETWRIPGEFKDMKQFIMIRRCDAYDDDSTS